MSVEPGRSNGGDGMRMNANGVQSEPRDGIGTMTPIPAQPGSVVERWALLVLHPIHSERDPKTIGEWASNVGISRSALCECCRLVHISPHDAKDFARMLRAIFRSGERWQPETVLDFADGRTLHKLLARAGLSPTPSMQTPTLEQFLDRQRWIPQDAPGLEVLRRLIQGLR